MPGPIVIDDLKKDQTQQVQDTHLASSKVNSEEDKEESGICVTVTPLEFRSSDSSEDPDNSSKVFSELSSQREIVQAKNIPKHLSKNAPKKRLVNQNSSELTSQDILSKGESDKAFIFSKKSSAEEG